MASHSLEKLPNPPSLVQYKDMKFLIFDSPNDNNLAQYISVFKSHNVTHIVRTCEPTYSKQTLEKEGFQFFDLEYTDGGQPPDEIIEAWKVVVKKARQENGCVGVHCVAGLGRAPVLVAVMLIESGMEPLAAVDYIRKQRRGAINAQQLRYIRNYKPSGKGCSIQ